MDIAGRTTIQSCKEDEDYFSYILGNLPMSLNVNGNTVYVVCFFVLCTCIPINHSEF